MASTNFLTPHDKHWQSYFTYIAPKYARLTSNTTFLMAQKALDIAPPPTTPTTMIHDHAAGPGTASLAMIEQTKTSGTFLPGIIATDYTPAMVAAIPTMANIQAQVADARALPFANNYFDYTISNISLQNLEDYKTGLREMYRTAKPGAQTVITQWEVFGTGVLMSHALQIMKCTKQSMPPVAGAELYEHGVIARLVAEAGWKPESIETHEVEVESDDLGGAHEFMTGRYVPVTAGLSDSEKNKYGQACWRVLREAAKIRCKGFVGVAKKER